VQAVDRAAWLAALARALDVPVVVTEEEPARNGATDPRIAPGAPVHTKPMLSSGVLGPPPFRL
jgi:hypothetical protein